MAAREEAAKKAARGEAAQKAALEEAAKKAALEGAAKKAALACANSSAVVEGVMAEGVPRVATTHAQSQLRLGLAAAEQAWRVAQQLAKKSDPLAGALTEIASRLSQLCANPPQSPGVWLSAVP